MIGIGQRLRQERSRLKLSQSALGAIGGVETNAQGNYESGARWPKADYLLRVAEAGVDLTYVLLGTRGFPADEARALAVLERPATGEHLDKVTEQLHRNLHGLIDALYQMTLLIDARANNSQDQENRSQLESISAEAQALAQASVKLIFTTSKLNGPAGT